MVKSRQTGKLDPMVVGGFALGAITALVAESGTPEVQLLEFDQAPERFPVQIVVCADEAALSKKADRSR